MQRERDIIKRQKQELESDFERLERNKTQEAEILNNQLYTLETAKSDEIRVYFVSYFEINSLIIETKD